MTQDKERGVKSKKAATDAFGAPIEAESEAEPDARWTSAVPSLRGEKISDLAKKVRSMRSAPPPSPIIDLRDGADEVQPRNPRVARALGYNKPDEAAIAAAAASLPRMPDPVTEESACEWLRQVIPDMDPRDKYTKDLVKVVQQYDFRQTKVSK